MPVHCMTLKERQEHHDRFRTTFVGGRLDFNTEINELPPRLRGRLMLAIATFNRFHPESDHSNGSFKFAGWIVTFEIIEDTDGLVLLAGLQEHFV